VDGYDCRERGNAAADEQRIVRDVLGNRVLEDVSGIATRLYPQALRIASGLPVIAQGSSTRVSIAMAGELVIPGATPGLRSLAQIPDFEKRRQ
jgi:hypothetical protein